VLNDNRPTEQGQGTASVAMECKKPTAGIVLAAGMSTRFGRPKQLLNLRGKTVLERTLDACLDSKLERIYLVLGYKHQEIIDVIFDKIDHQDMKIIINRDFQNGQSTSLRAGILEIRDTFSSAMFILGDQPFIDSSTLNVLLERYWASDKKIGAPFFQKTRGNPTIFSKKFYDDICSIEGDIGARKIIAHYPDQVLKIEVKRASFFHDIDTEHDFETAQSIFNSSSKIDSSG
jgi:molybdenum cofactor cytidylyltransferase